ncbi:uncharacterized protein EV420DRAFT_1487674 [Desarmillaria tabescens]|uniref:Uncharacterized protein n=1 Tax=Armillaria tabescens TaxID=1929756 RepID=A0AA39MIG6_ARMTA|nr:uncharacterized protein EV420DRAFT_1487674 [Desarmillaria tabescens]KAK0436081.1 hypothetical protein EV420DRAFT_1487674 [Desarmillaria tabescens]
MPQPQTRNNIMPGPRSNQLRESAVYLWMDQIGPQFEQAVLRHQVQNFLCNTYHTWFDMWPEDPQNRLSGEFRLARFEMRKILHVMDLGECWVVHGLIPKPYSGHEWESILDDLVVMADQAWGQRYINALRAHRMKRMRCYPFSLSIGPVASKEVKPWKDMRQHLWEAWMAKFPINFIALTGRYSTKVDESDCHQRKLRCIEAYLLRFGSFTGGHRLDILCQAAIFVDAQSQSMDLSSEEVPPQQTQITMPPIFIPCHSPCLLAHCYTQNSPSHSHRQTEHPITPSPSPPKAALHTSAIFQTPKTPLRTYANHARHRGTNLKYPAEGSQMFLSYPVRKTKISSMHPRGG